MINDFTKKEEPIYMDYNASTPVDRRVLEQMFEVYENDFGNPSSQYHLYGKRAAERIDTARRQVANLISCAANEIIFTSGATESCNLAIKGAAAAYEDRGNHIITSMAEHKAVLESCKYLANEGFDVSFLKPDVNGKISAEQIKEAMTDRTILVSIMTANNVTGTINPIDEIAALCKERGVLFFTDATQALGKILFSVEESGVDLAAFSSHKIYGPKGVGGLYIRSRKPRVRVKSLLHGGGHERNLRAGTENVAGIAGFGTACRLAQELLLDESTRIAGLVDQFEKAVTTRIADAQIIARDAKRLPNTTVISFPGIKAETLLRNTPEIAASAGAACDSSAGDTNYVLRAIGLEQDAAKSAVRFSLGRYTTSRQVMQTADYLAAKIGDNEKNTKKK